MIESLLCRLMGVVPAIDLQVSKQETRAVLQQLRDAEFELEALKALMAERFFGDWKVTKDGTRRYRKVASKVLVNSWITESEPLDDKEMVILPPPENWATDVPF